MPRLDHLAPALAVVLCLAVVGGIAHMQSDPNMVRLRRAEWVCTASHGGFEVRREQAADGRNVPKLVSISICDGWVRR